MAAFPGRQRNHCIVESVIDSEAGSEKDSECDTCNEPYVFSDDQRQSTCLKGFNELYETKQLFDLKLRVDNKEFDCHKSLLASSSEYFRTMFTTDLVEKDKSDITINGIDALSMELIVRYLYTGKVCMETDTVQNLLSAANLFQLWDLRRGCSTFMADKLDNDNCIGIHFFAQAHECRSLQEEARDMITENFLDVSESPEFLELAVDQLTQILRFDEIQTLDEDLFEAALAWLENNMEERAGYVYDVFSLIRYMLIDEYFLYDRVKSNTYLQAEPRIQTLLDEVIRHKMLKNRLVECDLMLEPRHGHDFTRVIVYTAYMDDEKRQVLQGYGGRWENISRTGNLGLCDIPAENPAILVTGDGDLYLAGGDDESAGLLKWSSDDNNFDDYAPMMSARKQFALVQVDKNIYAVGGCNKQGSMSRVDCYTEEDDEWKTVASLPKALRCFCAVSYGGKLYVFGGETEKTSKKVTRGRAELNKQALCYDPHDNKWTVLAEMSHARALAQCTVFRNKIYVIGGFGQMTDSWIKSKSPEHFLCSVEIYDPETNSWQEGPNLPVPLCGMGVIKYRATIYVLGGEDETGLSNSVYSLNTDGSTWQRREDDMITGITETTVHSMYAIMTLAD